MRMFMGLRGITWDCQLLWCDCRLYCGGLGVLAWSYGRRGDVGVTYRHDGGLTGDYMVLEMGMG